MNTLLLVLGQIIIYAVLMLTAEYAGFLLAVILGTISFFVWLVSHVVELIQPSKVSKKYYGAILSCWVAPMITVLGFAVLQGGFYWLE